MTCELLPKKKAISDSIFDEVLADDVITKTGPVCIFVTSATLRDNPDPKESLHNSFLSAKFNDCKDKIGIKCIIVKISLCEYLR